MKHNKKQRGFTIVELVIVIAVIAILAAVLIPTFAALLKKAKLSVDQQTVTNVNLILQTEEVDGKQPTTVDEVNKILEENGYRLPITPTTNGYAFYWIKAENRIVLVEMDGDDPKTIIYPADLQSYNDKISSLVPDTDWFDLNTGSGTPSIPVEPDVETEIPADYNTKAIWVYEEDSFTIENPNQTNATIKYNNTKTIAYSDKKYKNPEMPDFVCNTFEEVVNEPSQYWDAQKVCIRLNGTISASNTQFIYMDDLTIDLNGHELYRNNATQCTIIHMNSCTLNIFDSSKEQTGKIKGINGTAGASSLGFIDVSGTLNLYSGTLTNGKASQGGAVHMTGEGNIFNMYGGTITNCTTTGVGGGVEVMGKSTFNMYGGTISNNKASNGGGVYVTGSTFNMYGGTISGNQASSKGCGVYVYSETGVGAVSFTMSGGKIINNTSQAGSASVKGGGVCVNGSKQNIITFTMSGGEIKNNSATEGGGIYLEKGVKFKYEVVGSQDNISGNTGEQVSKNAENSSSIEIIDWTE